MTDTQGSGNTREDEARRNWTLEELRVLAAIYFNASFSIGDDGRDECRAIADCFGRTPSSVDRQWRNIDAVVKGKGGNIGNLVRQVASDYLAHPTGCRSIALSICGERQWPLESLVVSGTQPPLATSEVADERRELRMAFQGLLDHLTFKVFSSGSQGFFVQGKITFGGDRYQAQVTAVLIGSKRNLTVDVHATRDEVAYELTPLLDQLEAKRFKTGRTGFYTNGKAQVGAERFQVGIQAVQIGGR